MTDAELQQQSTLVFPGHRARSPAEMFGAMAAWCATNDVTHHDVYGAGALIERFEQQVADTLGMEAAVFCISGTMAQVTALRLACADRARPLVALHPTSHIFVHEKANYQLLNHFTALPVGERYRPWTVQDLASVPDRLGAVGIEIPMREIGGQTTPWDELEALKTHVHARGAHLHMDGARLWEAAAGYGKPVADIAAGCDSVYVSLYKGIGGLGGAMLAGTREFIDRAAEWFRREGGNVIHRSPYVVAAAMQFDERIAAMPAYFQRTLFLYDVLKGYPVLRVNPARPQANMLHIYLPVDCERALQIRRELAAEHGVWLFNRISMGVLPDTCFFELYVGDNLLTMNDQQITTAVAQLAGKLGVRPNRV